MTMCPSLILQIRNVHYYKLLKNTIFFERLKMEGFIPHFHHRISKNGSRIPYQGQQLPFEEGSGQLFPISFELAKNYLILKLNS